MNVDQLNALFNQIQGFALGAGLRLVVAIAILFVGRWAAKMAKRLSRQGMSRAGIDPTITSFASNVAHYGVLAIVLLIVLGHLGIETTSLIAILGTAGLAVGLALQGSLANFAAGMLIILFRPFQVGDWVKTGDISGIVEEIHLFTTVILTLDNRTVIIPNNQLTDNAIINYSTQGNIRVDLEVGISYNSDIDQAKAVVQSVLAANEKVLTTPPPMVGVIALADSSINLAVRPWTKVENYWDVYFATLENVKKQFDREGIQIPFPQRDLHLYSNGLPIRASATEQVLSSNGNRVTATAE